MAIPVPPVDVAPASTAAPAADDFDQRWAAWQARGIARDRIVHRRMAFAVPALVIAMLFGLWLLGR